MPDIITLLCKRKLGAFDVMPAKNKLPGKGYGLLPERELKEQPFDEVAVDLIGPWEVKIGNSKALTIIGLRELVRLNDKTAREVSVEFSQTWLIVPDIHRQ